MNNNASLKDYIKDDGVKVKVHAKGLPINPEQEDRIVDGIEIIIRNSRHIANKDMFGIRQEINDFFDMMRKNNEISDEIAENIDYTVIFD